MGVESADDLVLPRGEFDGGARLEQGALGQLTVWAHLLELEQHFLVLTHVRQHEIHAAHRLDLVAQVHLSLDLGLVLHQLLLGLLLQALLDLLGDLLVVHRLQLGRRALLQDVV